MGRAEEIFQRILEEGETPIDDFIHTRQSEELFLDFKRSVDNGSGSRLHSGDRENLAKAISGFGNSEGGVIVWGVECAPGVDYADVASTKRPIVDAQRFVSWLNGAVSSCTVPPHPGVTNKAIPLDSDPTTGFAITLIPKSSHAPHQCLLGKQYYYMRAGSSFSPVPHSVLAGMFGRRPQPDVIINFNMSPVELIDHIVKFSIGFVLLNRGPAIAKDVFLNVMIFSPGESCQIAYQFPDPNFSAYRSYGIHHSVISKDEFKLPPDGRVSPITTYFELAPPFSKSLEARIVFGCEGGVLNERILKKNRQEINRIYEELIDITDSTEWQRLIEGLMKFPEPSR